MRKVVEFMVLMASMSSVIGLSRNGRLIADYFSYKHVNYLCYFSCGSQTQNVQLVKQMSEVNIRTSVSMMDGDTWNGKYLSKWLHQWTVPVGVLLDFGCEGSQEVLEKIVDQVNENTTDPGSDGGTSWISIRKIGLALDRDVWRNGGPLSSSGTQTARTKKTFAHVLQASRASLFDSTHAWFVLASAGGVAEELAAFRKLNLSVNADLVLAASDDEKEFRLTDIFNFGKIQGNDLEKIPVGTWRLDAGLDISPEGFKYYNRWDFHNLTLRAVSVLLERSKDFHPNMLSDSQYRPGVALITKACAQLLDVIQEQHNFKFNITIASRWVGSPARNSTLAVTNAMFWREQDISYTCLRIFPQWLDWMEPFFPPPIKLETKFYYLISDKGVGDYENRFLSPLSQRVWVCIAATLAACALVLAGAAAVERHPEPALYAACSVVAAFCQQGRRMTLFTIGLTSMVLYNYYTSSVVSWLLAAVAPTIASMDGLIDSDLELVFENIGYTKSWLDNPGFYYFSGFKNAKEDEFRERKVINSRRTVPLMQSPERGVELIRTGAYAYHTEPYTASQVIGRRFTDRELCKLGALQMMRPAPVYVVGQKNSPYKDFFTWSLMRLQERGHYKATSARVGGKVPPCSGSAPRALALGQAAPAFALLAEVSVLSVFILAVEILWHRVQKRSAAIRRPAKSGP